MDLQRVWERVMLLAGFAQEDAGQYLPFCSVAAQEVAARVKPKADPEDDRLLTACAASAIYYAGLSQSALSGGEVSYKAGDVTITKSPALASDAAKEMRDRAFAAAADLLTDPGFAFEAVFAG